jgi:hypothetical protein
MGHCLTSVLTPFPSTSYSGFNFYYLFPESIFLLYFIFLLLDLSVNRYRALIFFVNITLRKIYVKEFSFVSSFTVTSSAERI